MFNKVMCKNYTIFYRIKTFSQTGEKYITGYIDYSGKSFRRNGNGFIADCHSCRYDYPKLVPGYIDNKITSLYDGVVQ